MKTKYRNIIGGLLSFLLFSSCSDDALRVVYPHSTPVVESSAVSPSSFTYGDSISFTAVVSDDETPLSTLVLQLVVNDQILLSKTIRTAGYNASVDTMFRIPFENDLPDNAEAEITLTLTNVEGDETQTSVSGITGQRTYYDKLYMVMEDGTVYTLYPLETGSDQYQVSGLELSNSITYKIATALTSENEIDYSGYVWGASDNAIELIEDETGDYITTEDVFLRRINSVTFDTYAFETTVTGTETDASGLYSSDLSDVTVSGESFKKVTRTLTNGQGLTLYEDFADDDIVFNLDYFDRIRTDSVSFTGETGSYVLYYSETRKIVLVSPVSQTFPSVLYACGMGLGYPSKVDPEATTSWGFDNALQFILFKKVDDNIYQSTVYFDASQANFKFFESTGWANEKRSDDYTLPASLIQSATDHGATDGNWYAADDAVSGNYRITINLSTNVVTAEAIDLE